MGMAEGECRAGGVRDLWVPAFENRESWGSLIWVELGDQSKEQHQPQRQRTGVSAPHTEGASGGADSVEPGSEQF
jgi:hypothetical protein